MTRFLFIIIISLLSFSSGAQTSTEPEKKAEEMSTRKPLSSTRTEDEENALRNREKRRKGVNQKYKGYTKDTHGDQPGIIPPGKDNKEKVE